MSIFAEGEALIDAAFEIGAVPVDYRRGGEAVATGIPAKLGRTLFREDDIRRGVSLRYGSRDFIIRAADLGIEPAKGDEIVCDGASYLVVAPDGEPCWEWHTRQSHSQRRIHARYAEDV